MLNRPLLIEGTIYISYIYWSLNLNLCFLANFELITELVALLFNNVSTITSTCISIISNPIFTVTFLNIFPLFRLQQNVLSITLLSIANLLLLEPNQGLLNSLPYLNYFQCSNYFYISVFSFVSYSIIYQFLQFLTLCPNPLQL